jgi:hypothetical protein
MRRPEPRDPNEEPIGKIVGRRKMRPMLLEQADRWMTEKVPRTHGREPSKTSPESAAPVEKPEPATS